MRRMKGITLMELLVVTLIVGLLAAISYPTYQLQVVKGRRAAGKAMLLQVMQQQERFYTENNTYTTSMASLGYGAGPTYYSENNTHSITLAAGPSGNIQTSVTISATPMVPDTRCGVLDLSSNMVKSASGTAPTTCW